MHSRIQRLGITVLALSGPPALAVPPPAGQPAPATAPKPASVPSSTAPARPHGARVPGGVDKPAVRVRAIEQAATLGADIPPRIAEVAFFEVRDRPLHDALRLLFKVAR